MQQRGEATAKAVAAAKGYWDSMTLKQRSEEMKRRAPKRKKKQHRLEKEKGRVYG